MERLDPAIRRQLLKDDAAWVGKPFDISGNARALQANTRHLALILMDTAAPDRASRAAAYIEDLIDATTAQHVTAPVACAKGCAHCCTTYVSTSLPEVFRLAQAIRGNTEITARVAAAAARSKAMTQLNREIDRVVCPILDARACAAYLHRPMVCRAVLSTSLDSCIRFFGHIGENRPFAYPDQLSAIRAFMVVILRAALVLCDLPHQNFELTHALDIALNLDDAEARWLAGEPVFAAVAMDRNEQQASAFMGLVHGLAKAVRPTL